MTRRLKYALMGSALSIGAPLGLMTLRFVDRVLGPAPADAPDVPENRRSRGGTGRVTLERILEADPLAYAYAAVSAAVALGLFGYALGRQADKLGETSELDPLTGLVNARGFQRRLGDEFSRSARYHEPLSLILIDVDGLKQINDRDGHLRGDAALRQVAYAMKHELRATDIAVRWGGDEFAVLAPHTSSEHAIALATRVRQAVASDADRPVTVSMGVACTAPGRGRRDTLEALIQAADAALYVSKRAGGNRVSIAETS